MSVQPEQLALKELSAQPDLVVHKAKLDQLVQPVLKVLLDRRAKQVLQGQLEQLVQQDPRVLTIR
jgi:hypothetical protein